MAENDSGGIGAKKGFLYQDYVAALFALKMLDDKSISEIRCEVSDDIDVVYDSYIEYVQVKTTKSDKAWQMGEFTKCSYNTKKTSTGKERKEYKRDSILHKSMDCDSEKMPGHFRIVTPRDVNAKLSFLKIPVNERVGKTGREAILKSLRQATKSYKTPNGNDVEYWLDRAVWEVIPTKDQIKLEAVNKIITVAHECYGVYLNPSRDPYRILNDLLVNLIEKSATSIVLRAKKNKIYSRCDLISWFKEEVLHYAQQNNWNVKIYTVDKKKLTAILYVFLELGSFYDHSGEKLCRGLQGKYHRRRYEYDGISKGILRWLPEVLLRPSELADQSPERLIAKLKGYTSKKILYLADIKNLIANVLLHSVVRTSYDSQPIPALLHVDDEGGTTIDNVHILLNDHEPDQLLLGFSYLISGTIDDSLNQIVSDFDALLQSDAFSAKKEKILEDKQDGYLLKHDVDEILSSNTSLDEHLSRFVFAFFIGYETEFLKCEECKTDEDCQARLEGEVRSHFDALISSLINKDDFFKDLHMTAYIYPVPSIGNLKASVEEEFSSNDK